MVDAKRVVAQPSKSLGQAFRFCLRKVVRAETEIHAIKPPGLARRIFKSELAVGPRDNAAMLARGRVREPQCREIQRGTRFDVQLRP